MQPMTFLMNCSFLQKQSLSSLPLQPDMYIHVLRQRGRRPGQFGVGTADVALKLVAELVTAETGVDDVTGEVELYPCAETDVDEPVSVAVTGQIVVEMAMVFVTRAVL